MSTVLLTASERVVAGRSVLVRVFSRDPQVVARAVTELQRHVRSLAVFGLFGVPSAVNYGTPSGDAYVGWVAGQTWRAPGSEYTVVQLAQAIAAAVPAGAATVAVKVYEVHDTTIEGIASSDPRGGGTAGSIARGAETAGEAITGTLGAVVDTAHAASDTARGLADLAGGAGQGARGVGAFLGDSPMLAFATVIGVMAFVVWARK
jgi:hypothetical protein